MKRMGVMLLLLLMIVGCARTAAPGGPGRSGGQGGADANPTGPAPAPVSAAAQNQAASLFPSADLALRFNISDTDSRQVTEHLVRDGERIIAGYDGKTYATWFVRETGIWRIDPKGGGALLRYLPPVLEAGAAWKQTSGDAEIWFRLDAGAERCPEVESIFRTQACWRLSVLNRGERTEFLFAPGYGPVRAKAENWVRPADSFEKMGYLESVPAPAPTPEQRSALVAQGVAKPAPEARVTSVTAETFNAALLTALKDATRQGVIILDLDGDGQPEYLQGPVGTWTQQPLLLYRGNLSLIRELRLWSGYEAHRITPLSLAGEKGSWLLYEQQRKGEKYSLISLLSPRGADVWGWALKASYTAASRVEVDQTGKMTVWWDWDDPARHTWVREYRLDSSNPDNPRLKQVASRFVPQGKALREPTGPEELVNAAFIAFWFDIIDEYARYTTSSDVIRELNANPGVRKAMYAPGKVQLGTVTLKQISSPGSGTYQKPEIVPGPVGPDGTVGFLALIGLYEDAHHVWGKVTFGQDAGGRMVITNILVEGTLDLY